MIGPETVIGILWLVWLASWGAAALWSAKTVARQPLSERLSHAVLWWAGATLLFTRRHRLGSLAQPLFPLPAWTAWLGVFLCAAGLAVAWWARIYIGRNWSGTVTLKEDHALIRNGPYARTRHPIYTGLLLALVGTALTRDSVAGVLGFALILAGIVVKLRQEERLLLGHFGPAYETYRAEVPALIPRIQ
jgi:protein-S-isoprenylcysteine O-methyltransferase Ste14